MIHPLITRRRSLRAFSDKSIDKDTLLKLFEAARWAPSSLNEQPWSFIPARKEETESFGKILSCLNESNSIWAQHSAVLIITLSKTHFTKNNIPNSHAQHDVGLAIGNLSLQATALDIFLHEMGGIDRDKIRMLFKIPTEFEIVSIIAGGYKGDPEMLPEHLREREVNPRSRKPLDEIIYSNAFGEKSTLLK